MDKKIGVIITAAGNGTRMGKEINKLFIKINEKPILAHTLSRFYDAGFTDNIIVALNPKDLDYFEEMVRKPYGFDTVKVVEGGAEREVSAYNGLKALDPDTDYVLIHDGARPFVSEQVIQDCIQKTIETGAAIAATPATNTIKVSNNGETVDHTPARATLFEAQTPQGFAYDLIMDANEKRMEDPSSKVTDDASIAELAGYDVTLSKGDRNNIKITSVEDLLLAEVLAQVLYSD